jgi:hypothetical protein
MTIFAKLEIYYIYYIILILMQMTKILLINRKKGRIKFFICINNKQYILGYFINFLHIKINIKFQKSKIIRIKIIMFIIIQHGITFSCFYGSDP